MGKAKKVRKLQSAHRQHHLNSRNAVGAKPGKAATSKASSTSTFNPKSKPKPPSTPLPLSPSSKILLCGEGSFTFSLSLATHHGCTRLTATTLETGGSLAAKHPSAGAATIPALLAASPHNRVLYGIDATRLGLPHVPCAAPIFRARGTYDAVWFNFPHVGGRSTDVNRQVRANQALVVAFLEGCLRVLRPGGKAVVSLFQGMP
ncbi:MAG: hypothetical protein LQ340_003213, partial [Diploschistes diacapsis]